VAGSSKALMYLYQTTRNYITEDHKYQKPKASQHLNYFEVCKL